MKIDPLLKGYSFKVLGLRFTHKSKLLPKSMVNYYEETYRPRIGRPLLEWIPFYLQKGLNALFPNYLIETPNQYSYRRHWNTYEVDAWFDFMKKLKNGNLKDVKLNESEIQKILNGGGSLPYLRKLYDEGKLGKPKP